MNFLAFILIFIVCCVPTNLQLLNTLTNFASKAFTDPFGTIRSSISGYDMQQPYYTSQNSPQVQSRFGSQPSTYQSNIPSTGNCEQYFSYSGTSVKYGIITIPQFARFNRAVSNVNITWINSESKSYVGGISLLNDKFSTRTQLMNGQPLQLRVDFPMQNPLPQVTEIRYNDEVLCHQDFTNTYTVRLGYTFTTDLPSNYYPTKTKTFTTPTTVTTTISTTTTMRVPEKVDDEPKISFEELQKVCGTTSFKPKTTSGFIKNGKKAVRGQFPWLVSYFIRGRKGLQLSCGASLVSQKLLITAAHCVHPKGQIEPFKAENSIFVFGNEINDLTERFNDLSLAKELIIHPKWNSDPSTTYEYDIAIVVLSNNIIDFNKFIRPICLWTKTNDYSDMIGKVGTVAGWGKTEFDAVNTEGALYAISPVVKNKVCLDSNIEFAKIMSDKSFCAGEKGRDSGPCNGDSGGAFVFEENHKSYLRGIISSGIFNYAAQSCDPREYVVFTDVAKFTSWIKDYISRYG